MTAGADPRDPRLSSDQHLLPASVHSVLDGPAAGSRVLLVQPSGGLHARVLLDRGLDLGAVWYAGYPISWTSPAGERRAGAADLGEGWHRGWAGGLLTTCGLRHIGPPGNGFGRHGRYSECPAEDLVVRRLPGPGVIEVSGSVRETDGLDRGLVLHRTMRWHAGVGRLELRDVLENQTVHPAAAPILYHVNLGYPFLTERSSTAATGLQVGDGFHPAMGAPAAVADEVVVHRRRPEVESATMTVRSPGLGLRLRISWSSAELDRAYTWRRREPGCYVQAVEPANGSLTPTADDPWPRLAAGERRETGFDLVVEADTAETERS